MNKYIGFTTKKLNSFSRYPYIPEVVILESFLAEIKDNKLPIEVTNLLKEAWRSRFWEVKGYDGATLVKDKNEPRIDNFLHDYCYRSGYVNDKVDIIYRELMMLTGYSKSKAYRRYNVIKLVRPYFIITKKRKGEYKENDARINELYERLISKNR